MVSPDVSAPDSKKKSPVSSKSNPAPPDPALPDPAPSNQSTPDDSDGAVAAAVTPDQIDDVFKELKTLLSTVEKLQKARHDVGDIKPLLLRLLDGELLSGEDLDQLKSGVSGLSKLVKFYGDYQLALENAQPARALLDDVLKS
ncbi:MAG: hypothetical protein WBA57_16985 [Elainellaceae cyanobacterium]